MKTLRQAAGVIMDVIVSVGFFLVIAVLYITLCVVGGRDNASDEYLYG